MATLDTGWNDSDPVDGQELYQTLKHAYHSRMKAAMRRQSKYPSRASTAPVRLWWHELQFWLGTRGVLLEISEMDCDNSQAIEGMLENIAACETCGDLLRLFPAARTESDQRVRQLFQHSKEEDMAAAKCAWETPYIVSEEVLSLVGDQLESYAKAWKASDWYAPLVALVQSSGWGKSRLICQLWRRGFFVVYISCMGSRQTGFPTRTPLLAEILLAASSTEATFVALVVSIMAVVNQHVDMTGEEWIQKQEKNNRVQAQIYAHYTSIVQSIEGHASAIEAKVCALSTGKARSVAECLIQEHEKYFRTCFQEYVQKLEQTGRRLLLCVDEAGELNENFIKFRRALRSIPQGSSFFSVVIGTDRKVADLAAASEVDASARARLATRCKPYHPIYLIGKSDIFAQDGAASGSEASSREIATSLDPEHVIRFGRPLWAAYYDSVEASDKFQATVDLAKMKLLGQDIDIKEPGWVTRDIAVAVFACIVGLDVVAWGLLPQQLVAKHMRTIVNISKDGTRVHTAAAVEPVLAVAAAELLHANDDAFLGDFLVKLIEVCLDGLVLEGVRGEFVVRIVLMLAMHECTKGSGYIQPVTLGTFLETMFGSSIVEELKANCASVEGVVFFNSFTATSLPPSQKLLNAAFARCTAISGKGNERVLDFALPVRAVLPGFVDRHGLSRGAKKQVLENVGSGRLTYVGAAIPGQVKNVRGKQSVKEAMENLQNEDRLNSCAEFFFQIGHRGEDKVVVDHTTVVAYGLDCFKHLKSKKMEVANVVDKLKLLSRTCEEVFKDASDAEQAVLQEMIPMGYDRKQFLEDTEKDDLEDDPME